jgi:hypothetical protein
MPSEKYIIMYNYIKFIISKITQYYRQSGTEYELLNYISVTYPKIRIQNDIMGSSPNEFVNILNKDNELAEQYNKFSVDLQNIEQRINQR